MNGILGLDGYTGYLVVAYAVTALVLVGNVVAARRQFRRTVLRLQQQLERRVGRRSAPVSAIGGEGAGRVGDKGGNEATVGRSS